LRDALANKAVVLRIGSVSDDAFTKVTPGPGRSRRQNRKCAELIANRRRSAIFELDL